MAIGENGFTEIQHLKRQPIAPAHRLPAETQGRAAVVYPTDKRSMRCTADARLLSMNSSVMSNSR